MSIKFKNQNQEDMLKKILDSERQLKNDKIEFVIRELMNNWTCDYEAVSEDWYKMIENKQSRAEILKQLKDAIMLEEGGILHSTLLSIESWVAIRDSEESFVHQENIPLSLSLSALDGFGKNLV